MALHADLGPENFATLRQTMVESQIRTFDVTDHAVIGRFLDVPREDFVPTAVRGLAYSDTALKIAAGRRLLTPMVLARMVQAAGLKPGDHVLDIAPGTGYSTAILAGLTPNLAALESDPELQALTKANLAASGFSNVPVFGGPLREGAASAAPFDVIFVNGAVEAHLDHLCTQLRDCGKLIALWRTAGAANKHACRAVLFEKNAGALSRRDLFDAAGPLLEAFRAEPAFVF
jgi:protein-L-isoaspartate(D-aspartate) O-methyltransferase